jgi:riboflavin kinase / FMN adenylyltransferase
MQTLRIRGIVVKGRQQGRKIGFPTANIQAQKLIKNLDFGIYAGRVELVENKKIKSYKAAISFGPAPTFEVFDTSLEAHILDFDREIYGEKVCVQVNYFLRKIEKYDSIEELKDQIQKDCERTREILRILDA